MSDKILYNISDKEIKEMEDATEGLKIRAIKKNSEDVEVMTALNISIKQYLRRFGKESNLHEKLTDVFEQVQKNIYATIKHMDNI